MRHPPPPLLHPSHSAPLPLPLSGAGLLEPSAQASLHSLLHRLKHLTHQSRSSAAKARRHGVTSGFHREANNSVEEARDIFVRVEEVLGFSGHPGSFTPLKADEWDVIVCAASRLLGWRGALMWLERMRRHSLAQRPSSTACNAVMGALSRSKRAGEALELLSRMDKEGVDTDCWTYSAALGACSWCWEGVELYDRLRAEGVQMDVFCCNSALAACRHLALPDKAAEILQDMKASGVRPDAGSYKLAIHSLHSLLERSTPDNTPTDHSLSARALALYSDFQRQLNDGPCPQVLSATMRVLLKEGQWREVLLLLDDSCRAGCGEGEGGVDLAIVNIGLGACAMGRDMGKANDILEVMRACQLSPSIMTFNAYINCLAECGLWQDALALVDPSRALGSPPALPPPLPPMAPNIETYNQVLKALERSGEWKIALQLLMHQLSHVAPSLKLGEPSAAAIRDERGRVIAPDAISYTTVLKACSREGRWRAALRVFYWMRQLRRGKEGVDRLAYTTAISACARAGEVGFAESLFEEAKREGVLPDLIMVNALLDACDKAGEWERAVDILTQLKETPFPSLRPDHRSFNSVISACSKNGQMDLAFSFTLEMQTYGFRPNEVTYHALVFAADDRLRPPDDATADVSAEELDNFLGDVYDSTSDAPDPVAYGAAIASCRRRGDWKQAFSILREMKGHGLTPTSFCYTATLQTLIAAAKSGRYTGDGEGEGGGEGAESGPFAHHSWWSHAVSLMEDMREDNVPPDKNMFATLIDLLDRLGHGDLALELYREAVDRSLLPSSSQKDEGGMLDLSRQPSALTRMALKHALHIALHGGPMPSSINTGDEELLTHARHFLRACNPPIRTHGTRHPHRLMIDRGDLIEFMQVRSRALRLPSRRRGGLAKRRARLVGTRREDSSSSSSSRGRDEGD
ncbi:unnamed protein product [Vitrella brassicaformis CCMP3155]|uniref:Pentacotripeptide-repeat region of PRORP domain-containing protein n=2 Tax=Vitrella brassicaformis TaxID=1169539 RepID=A0A0G4EXP3_VITBC|nr:unnamed protein product [Vitrella brassicaformis CCMP3155]|eukprot:CEM03124.1 unnamed protein product [Vitrella brassicaformis CCMP3155]